MASAPHDFCDAEPAAEVCPFGQAQRSAWDKVAGVFLLDGLHERKSIASAEHGYGRHAPASVVELAVFDQPTGAGEGIPSLEYCEAAFVTVQGSRKLFGDASIELPHRLI